MIPPERPLRMRRSGRFRVRGRALTGLADADECVVGGGGSRTA